MRKSQDLVEGRVRVAVEAKLRDILCDSNAEIRGEDRLVGDLHIDSDDLSFVFVPELETEFGVSLPRRSWEAVEKVDDAIKLLTRALIGD